MEFNDIHIEQLLNAIAHHWTYKGPRIFIAAKWLASGIDCGGGFGGGGGGGDFDYLSTQNLVWSKVSAAIHIIIIIFLDSLTFLRFYFLLGITVS